MNRSEISGAPESVFDLVTTGKYWTRWHPATLGVSGDIDAPMKLGDTIREHARIGAGEGEADWKVVEHERPRGVVLRTQTPTFTHLQITYTFTPRGNAVEFTRALEYELNPALGFAASPVMDFQHRDDARLRPLMEQQSAEAVTRLKVFVEQMKQK